MASVLEAIAPTESVRSERARILSTLLADLDALVEVSANTIRAEIPAYAAQSEEFFADVREQVAAHYRTKLTAFLEERAVTLEEVAFIRGAAMRRARAGLALEHYIAAFRVGEKVLWNAILTTAGSSPSGREAALTLAAPLMRYVDFVITHAAHAYAEFRQFAVADADRERRDLLEQLLTGEMPSDPQLRTAAEEHAIVVDSQLAVVVAVRVHGSANGVLAYAVRGALTHAGCRETEPLVVVRRNEIVGLFALRSRDARELCARLEASRERLAEQGIVLAMSVGTIADGVREVPRAYREAREALARVAESGGLVALPCVKPFDYLTSRCDETVPRLIDPELRAFLAQDRERGRVLTRTIQAFAESDLNLRSTAGRLHVHPNTVQYRLRRVEERTRRNARRISDLIELLVAIALDETIRAA